MTVQDIDTAHEIWGKKIAALKVKSIRKKTIHVEGDIVKIPKELINLHKYEFMT